MSQTSPDSGRVSDAPSDNWVYRVLPRAAWPYAQLARWDRPIGWQLLMWPCFWSAALAANVSHRLATLDTADFALYLALFLIGAIAMRGAGCTYNDLVDHEIDMAVARTRSRPLPSGRVTRMQANLKRVANPQSGETLRRVGRLEAELAFGRIDEILADGLHPFLDGFLAEVADLGGRISQDFLVPSV